MTQEQIIEEFERAIFQPRSIKADIKERIQDALTIETRNPIKLKGLKSQVKKTKPAPNIDLYTAKQQPENRLHQMIASHPFLLHTPELYAGGLYLDSVLNKHRLPCNLVPDFTYITVQDRVIKITLVEIEQAAKGVFHHGSSRKSKQFCSGAMEGITQVRKWQASMENEDMRRALLLNLKPLFDHYPVGLFEPDGRVSRRARISLGYVLVVGAEAIQPGYQQDMIDDLYLNENILFMTYPSMIEQVRCGLTQKNMLKVGPNGVRIQTRSDADQLLGEGSELDLSKRSDTDPFGIKMAGLGWWLSGSARQASATHPNSIKQIFYRAGGRCEEPGCPIRIVRKGGVLGQLRHIYNVIDDQSDVLSMSDTDNVALLCIPHANYFNNSSLYTLGKTHPMSGAMRMRKAYRADLDADASAFVGNWQSTLHHPILKALDIDAEQEPLLAEDMQKWTLAVASLPWHYQHLLYEIVSYHFEGLTNQRFDRTGNRWYERVGFHYLWKAGLVRPCDYEKSGMAVEPIVFNHKLIKRIRAKFRRRTNRALQALCRANARDLQDHNRWLAMDEARPIIHY